MDKNGLSYRFMAMVIGIVGMPIFCILSLVVVAEDWDRYAPGIARVGMDPL